MYPEFNLTVLDKHIFVFKSIKMWPLPSRGSEEIVWNPNEWIASTMKEAENRGRSNI